MAQVLRDNGVYQLPDFDRTKLVAVAEDGAYLLYTLPEWERHDSPSYFTRPSGEICRSDGKPIGYNTTNRLHDTGQTMPKVEVANA